MKKLALTIALLLGLTMTTFADGGLFKRGYNAENGQASGYIYFGAKAEGDNAGSPAMPLLPQHGEDTNQPAPLGSWANAAERNKLKPNASENIRKRIGYIRVSSVRE